MWISVYWNLYHSIFLPQKCCLEIKQCLCFIILPHMTWIPLNILHLQNKKKHTVSVSNITETDLLHSLDLEDCSLYGQVLKVAGLVYVGLHTELGCWHVYLLWVLGVRTERYNIIMSCHFTDKPTVTMCMKLYSILYLYLEIWSFINSHAERSYNSTIRLLFGCVILYLQICGVIHHTTFCNICCTSSNKNWMAHTQFLRFVSSGVLFRPQSIYVST